MAIKIIIEHDDDYCGTTNAGIVRRDILKHVGLDATLVAKPRAKSTAASMEVEVDASQVVEATKALEALAAAAKNAKAEMDRLRHPGGLIARAGIV